MSLFPQNNINNKSNSTSSTLSNSRNPYIVSQNLIVDENKNKQKEDSRCCSSTTRHVSLRTVVTASFATIGLAVTAIVILIFMSFFSTPIDGAILTFSGELGEQLRQTVVSNFDAGADAFFGLINFTTHQAGQMPFDPTEMPGFVKPNRRIDAYMNKIAVTTLRKQRTPWTATAGRFSDGSYYSTERYQIADPSNPQGDSALISFAEICNSYTGLYSSTTTAFTIDVPYNCSFRQFYTNNFSTSDIRQDLITANGLPTVTMPVSMRSDLFANSPLWKLLERMFTGPGSANLFAFAVPPFLIVANASITQRQQQTQANTPFPDKTFRLLFGLLSMVFPRGNRSESPIGWVASGVDMTVLSGALKTTLSAAKYRIDGEQLDFRAFLVDSSGQSATSTLSIEDQHTVVACSDCGSTFTVMPAVVLADYTTLGGQIAYPRGCSGRGVAFMACLQNISDYAPYDLLKQHLQQNERITNKATPTRVANGTYIYSLTTEQDGEKFVIYKMDDVNTRSSRVFTANSAVSGFKYDLLVFIPRKYFTKRVDERMMISIVVSVAISVFTACICLIFVNAGVKKLEVFVEEMKQDPMRMEQQKNKDKNNESAKENVMSDENNLNDDREVENNNDVNDSFCSASSFEEIVSLDDAFADLRSMIFLLRGFFPDPDNPLLGASVMSTATSAASASETSGTKNVIKVEKLMGNRTKKNNLNTENCDQHDESSNNTNNSANNNKRDECIQNAKDDNSSSLMMGSEQSVPLRRGSIENINGTDDEIGGNGNNNNGDHSVRNNANRAIASANSSSRKAVSFLPGFVEQPHEDERRSATNNDDDDDDDDNDFAIKRNHNNRDRDGNEKINPKTMNLVDLADSGEADNNEHFAIVDLDGEPQDTPDKTAATPTTKAATKSKQNKNNNNNQKKYSRKSSSPTTTRSSSTAVAPLSSTTIVRDKLGNPFVKGLVCVINIIGTTESFTSSLFDSNRSSSSLLSSLLHNNNTKNDGSNRSMRKGKTNAFLTPSGSSSSLSSQQQHIIIPTKSRKEVDETTRRHLASSSAHNFSYKNKKNPDDNDNENGSENRFDNVKHQIEQNLERQQREQELRVQVLERAGRRLTKIVTILRDKVVTSTGAHLVEFRGDHFVLCLKLSARTLPSRLAQRFVGQLMDAAEEIAEIPEQRSLNAPSFDRCCENVAQGLMRQQQKQNNQIQKISANYLSANDNKTANVNNNNAADQNKNHKYAVHALLHMVNSAQTHRENIANCNNSINLNGMGNNNRNDEHDAHTNSNEKRASAERDSYTCGKTIYTASFFNSAQFSFGSLALTAGIAVGPVRVLHNNMFFASQEETHFFANTSITNSLFDNGEKPDDDEEEKQEDENDNNRRVESQNKKIPPLFSAANSIGGGGRPTNYLGNAFGEALAVEQASRRAVVHGLESQKIRLMTMYLNEVVKRKQYKRRLRQHANKQKSHQQQQLQSRQPTENIFVLSPPGSNSASPNNTLVHLKNKHSDSNSNSKEKQNMNLTKRRESPAGLVHAMLHDDEDESDRHENEVDNNNNNNNEKLARNEKLFACALHEEGEHEDDLMSKSNISNTNNNNQKLVDQHSSQPEKTLPKNLMSSAATEARRDNVRETKYSGSSSGVGAFDLSSKAAQQEQQRRRSTMFPTCTESNASAARNENNNNNQHARVEEKEEEESDEDYDDDDDDSDDLVVPIIVTATESTESMTANQGGKPTSSSSASYQRHLYFDPTYRSARTNQYEKVSSLPHCIAYCIEAGTVGATVQLPAKALHLPQPVVREKINVENESSKHENNNSGNNRNDDDQNNTSGVNQQQKITKNKNDLQKEKQFVVVKKFQNPLIIKELMGDNVLVCASVARFVTGPL